MNALARVADARTIRIEDETAKRGIKLRGGVDRCGPCPRCGGTDRFSINTKKQVFNCRGFEGGDVIALVQHIDGVSFLDAIAYLAGAEPSSIVSNIRKQPGPVVKQRDEAAERRQRNLVEADNREFALRLWRQAVDPRGTIVEAYLRNRCLELPGEAANEAIRFHPDCPFGTGSSSARPAMVCLVRNIVSNDPRGLHRTALAPDGTAIKCDGKTFRMSLGTIAGGAIKLDPDEDVALGLCIGEGVETCLSGRQIGLQPVWSAVSTGGVANFPVLPGVDGLHIFAENDANGASAKAVEACARRWYEACRDVIVVEPDTAKDLNDELREAAR
jgi:Toprim domain/CHC2 zinc finger